MCRQWDRVWKSVLLRQFDRYVFGRWPTSSGFGLFDEMRRQQFRDVRKRRNDLHLLDSRHIREYCTDHAWIRWLLRSRQCSDNGQLSLLPINNDLGYLSTCVSLQGIRQFGIVGYDLLLCDWRESSRCDSGPGALFHVSLFIR